MRFLSKYAGATLPAIPPVEQPMPNGRLAVVDKGVTCEFKPLHTSEYEFGLALREFRFNGMPMEMDGKTDVSPRYRIGVYDTDKEAREHNWNDETKTLVEQALLRTARNDNLEAIQQALVAGNEYYNEGHPSDRAEFTAAHQQAFEKWLIYVEPQQIPKPWNTYDELVAGPGKSKEAVAEKIVELTLEIGLNPRDVLEYERAHRKRPAVIEKLEALVAPAVADPDEITVTS